MEIILSKQCTTLSGSLGQGFGYFIVNRKGRYYSVRSKHSVPHDGHWRFITTCADLAQSKLHISDIRVSPQELSEALSEAGLAPSLRDSDIPGFRDSGLPLSGAPHDNLSSSVSPESDSGSSSGARHDSAEFLSSADILTLKERMSL